MNTDNIIDNVTKASIDTNISFKRKPYYIYNFMQINWLLKQKCQAVEIGRGKNGDIYLKFPRTPENEAKVNKWKLSQLMLNDNYTYEGFK